MVRLAVLVIFILSVQLSSAQGKQGFCGASINKLAAISKLYKTQFDFLQVNEHDTIVDIGAASGWYEGAFSAYAPYQDLSFILVDLSSECLTRSKVDSMISHYAQVKKAPITNHFILVKNTPDSLFLPLARFKKVWMMNTFHEVEDQKGLLKQIKDILVSGGEMILLDVVAQKPGQLHGGCHKALISQEAMKQIVEANGFTIKEDLVVRTRNGLPEVVMIRFIRKD